MIDPTIFRASRDAARNQLSIGKAQSSFGYHIDVDNLWESYRSGEDLVRWFGIHSTHIHQFQEIIEDLGYLTKTEWKFAEEFANFYDQLTRIFTTTGFRSDLKFDLAETLFDWRVILKFVELPARILDFGAGGGRQNVSSFLHHRENQYTSVESTLNAYTVQNQVQALINIIAPEIQTVDFLDYQTSGLKFPNIASTNQGGCFHLPAWLTSDLLPEKFFDLILACHVHNELSQDDFMRLIALVSLGLSENGIFYIRSELGVYDTRDFMDSVDLHGIDIVEELAKNDIIPIYSTYECAFQTTVFARKTSSRFNWLHRIRSSTLTFLYNSFAPKISRNKGQDDMQSSKELSSKAGVTHALRNLRLLIFSRNKIVFCVEDRLPFYKRAILKLFVTILAVTIIKSRVYNVSYILSNRSECRRTFSEFASDIVVIVSNHQDALEKIIRDSLLQDNFVTRKFYWQPFRFLCRKPLKSVDPIFRGSIYNATSILDSQN
ncbi:MAG: hypothetical protein QF394_07145 [Rhodospirillales bacterium]|nr:hypothetical protein [Rhodospirillales bacterium]